MIAFEQTFVEKPSYIPRRLSEWVINWPVEFFVCEDCKSNYFVDYENAIICQDDCCTLCSPCENDALGG